MNQIVQCFSCVKGQGLGRSRDGEFHSHCTMGEIFKKTRRGDKICSQYIKGEHPAHAFPGGYPVAYLDVNNNVLCADCADKSVVWDKYPDKWVEDVAVQYSSPVDAFINYEENDLYCDACGKQIESAYGEDMFT